MPGSVGAAGAQQVYSLSCVGSTSHTGCHSVTATTPYPSKTSHRKLTTQQVCVQLPPKLTDKETNSSKLCSHMNSNQFKGREKALYVSPAVLTVNTTCSFHCEVSIRVVLMQFLPFALAGFLEAPAGAAFGRPTPEGVSYPGERGQGTRAAAEKRGNVISHSRKQLQTSPVSLPPR